MYKMKTEKNKYKNIKGGTNSCVYPTGPNISGSKNINTTTPISKYSYEIGKSKCYGQNSIIIGSNLSTDKDYHLLIDEGGVKIDKIMTIEEHALLSDVIKAMCYVRFH